MKRLLGDASARWNLAWWKKTTIDNILKHERRCRCWQHLFLSDCETTSQPHQWMLWNSWLIDNHASFQQQLIYMKHLCKDVVLIQLSKMGLMIAWQTHCLPEDAKIPRWRVHKRSIKEHGNIKTSLGLPQNVVSRFFKKCSSIVTAAKNHSFGCAPAKSTGGFRGPLSVFDFGDPSRAFALGVFDATSKKTRNGSVTVKLFYTPPNWLLLDPTKKNNTNVWGSGCKSRMEDGCGPGFRRKFVYVRPVESIKCVEFLKSRDIVIAGTPKMRLEIGELIEIPVKHPGIFSMISSWNRRT